VCLERLFLAVHWQVNSIETGMRHWQAVCVLLNQDKGTQFERALLAII
jgi:hypothetical protein